MRKYPDGDYNNKNYIIRATEDPQLYSDYSVRESMEDPNRYEIYLQYMYPRDGQVLPIGIQRTILPYTCTMPSEYKNIVTTLFENSEICRLEYRGGPPESLWPK